jgi:hypothetical protein
VIPASGPHGLRWRIIVAFGAGALLVSAVLVVLQIVITVIAAAFYNVFAELFGGVEMTISEDESAL